MTEAEQITAAMAVRDLMSATQALLEMPVAQIKTEIDDIELGHARLSRLISRICSDRKAHNGAAV